MLATAYTPSRAHTRNVNSCSITDLRKLTSTLAAVFLGSQKVSKHIWTGVVRHMRNIGWRSTLFEVLEMDLMRKIAYAATSCRKYDSFI